MLRALFSFIFSDLLVETILSELVNWLAGYLRQSCFFLHTPRYRFEFQDVKPSTLLLPSTLMLKLLLIYKCIA